MSDNAALSRACRPADRGVVGVLVICPHLSQAHDGANARVALLLHNRDCLLKRLEKLSTSGRIIERQTLAQASFSLLAIARAHRCDALYFARAYDVNEPRRAADVTRSFEQAALRVHAVDETAIRRCGKTRRARSARRPACDVRHRDASRCRPARCPTWRPRRRGHFAGSHHFFHSRRK